MMNTFMIRRGMFFLLFLCLFFIDGQSKTTLLSNTTFIQKFQADYNIGAKAASCYKQNPSLNPNNNMLEVSTQFLKLSQQLNVKDPFQTIQTTENIPTQDVTSVSNLSDEEKQTLTSLVLSGDVTNADFIVMRSQMPQLLEVNMLNTTIDKLPSHAFSGNTTITTVQLPATCKEIGDFAFNNCKALKEAPLVEGLETIGQSAFSGCDAFITVTIPSTVMTIEPYAFTACKSLKSFVLAESLYFSVFKDILYNKNQTELICCPIAKNDTLRLPSTLKKIHTYALEGCQSLKGELIFPASIEEIGAYAFNNCKNLSGELVLPSTLKVIGEQAFWGCSKITGTVNIPEGISILKTRLFAFDEGINEITIPSTLNSFHEGALEMCTGLLKLTLAPSTPPSVATYTFRGIDKDIPYIEVSDEVRSVYQLATSWKDFTNYDDHYVNYDRVERSAKYYIQYVGEGINNGKYLSFNTQTGQLAIYKDSKDEATEWQLDFFDITSTTGAVLGGKGADLYYMDETKVYHLNQKGESWADLKNGYNIRDNRTFAFWMENSEEGSLSKVAIQGNGTFYSADSENNSLAVVTEKRKPQEGDFNFRLIRIHENEPVPFTLNGTTETPSEDIQVPIVSVDPDVYYRMICQDVNSGRSGKCVYSTFASLLAGTKDLGSSAQLWKLIEGENEFEGLYCFQNKLTKKYMTIGTTHSDGNGDNMKVGDTPIYFSVEYSDNQSGDNGSKGFRFIYTEGGQNYYLQPKTNASINYELRLYSVREAANLFLFEQELDALETFKEKLAEIEELLPNIGKVGYPIDTEDKLQKAYDHAKSIAEEEVMQSDVDNLVVALDSYNSNEIQQPIFDRFYIIRPAHSNLINAGDCRLYNGYNGDSKLLGWDKDKEDYGHETNTFYTFYNKKIFNFGTGLYVDAPDASGVTASEVGSEFSLNHITGTNQWNLYVSSSAPLHSAGASSVAGGAVIGYGGLNNIGGASAWIIEEKPIIKASNVISDTTDIVLFDSIEKEANIDKFTATSLIFEKDMDTNQRYLIYFPSEVLAVCSANYSTNNELDETSINKCKWNENVMVETFNMETSMFEEVEVNKILPAGTYFLTSKSIDHSKVHLSFFMKDVTFVDKTETDSYVFSGSGLAQTKEIEKGYTWDSANTTFLYGKQNIEPFEGYITYFGSDAEHRELSPVTEISAISKTTVKVMGGKGRIIVHGAQYYTIHSLTGAIISNNVYLPTGIYFVNVKGVERPFKVIVK